MKNGNWMLHTLKHPLNFFIWEIPTEMYFQYYNNIALILNEVKIQIA